MQVGKQVQSTTPLKATSSVAQITPSSSSTVEASQIPLSPDAGKNRPTHTKPTNFAAMVSTGLKVGAAVMGVMIGAAGLGGCASTNGVYQGPSYADYHRATLTWESPTSHTDGTAFRDENGDGRIDGVRGFIVYRGDGSGNYTESRDITRPDCKRLGARTLCTYAWSNLPSGTHYFAVKAFKEVTPGSRSISDFSNEASKTIP